MTGPGGDAPPAGADGTAPAARADATALAALSAAYAAAVDTRDGERFAALFTEDGELVVPEPPATLHPVHVRSGAEALRRIPAALGRYAHTFHQVSNHDFAVGAGVASGTVWCVAHHLTVAPVPAGGPPAGTDTVWFIRYEDEYRHGAGGWRFRRRALHLLWVEERPAAVAG